MAGGSREPESDDDTQCQHCGLWFGQEGVVPHERSCDLAGYDARKVPLEDAKARVRAGLTFDDSAPDDDLEDTDDETADVVASDPGATRPDDGGDPDAETATDGGPRDPPEFSDDGDSGDETAASEPECPSCGAGESYLVPVDVLPDSVLAQGPGEKDVLCLACSSVDRDGAVTTEIVDGDEVLRINAFDADEVAA